MDYSYQRDNRPNPESRAGHPQNQHALHYQHQDFASQHHALQTGYPGLRFAPYINSLQGPGSAPHQVLDQDGHLASRSPPGPAQRETGQRLHEYDGILPAALLGTTSLHYRPDLANSQLQQVPATSAPPTSAPPPLQQQQQPPAAHTTTPDPCYRIEDLSHSAHAHNPMVPATNHHHPTTATTSTTTGNKHHHPSNSAATPTIVSPGGGSTNRRKEAVCSPRGRTKRVGNPEPAVQVVEPQVQRKPTREYVPLTCAKSVQTEPMFAEQARAADTEESAPDLPESLAFVETRDEAGKITGVVAQSEVAVGEEFGPFTGEFVKEGIGCYDPSTWEICVKGKPWFYISGASDQGNWMKHVQVARTTAEQNLEAFQAYGDIFFRSTRTVKAGTELRVGYARDYGHRVGLTTELSELVIDKGSERFECQSCQCRYANAKSMLRHIKFEHNDHKCVQPVNNTPIPVKAAEKAIIVPKKSLQKPEKRGGLDDQKLRAEARRKSKLLLRVNLMPRKKNSQGSPAGVSSRESPRNKVAWFSCKKCSKLFPSEGRLKEHAAFHQETKDIKPVCETCGLECKHSRALKQHMLSHDPEAFQCQYCKKYFKRKGCYVYHMRHDHEVFVGARWMRWVMEERATRYVGPEKQTDESELFHPELPQDMLGKRILIKSNKPKVYKCKYCPKRYSAHYQVFKHERTAHTNSGRFKCDFCSMTFNEETRFIIHRRKHTENRPYKCTECPRSFGSESALTNHLPEHRGERPFRCEVCGKAFRTRKYMTTHKRRQHTTPSVLLKCSFCEKTFKHKTGLYRHEKCHKGIRPHVCLTCGKAFGTKYTLQAHSRVHTGDRPFECRVCHKRFSLNHHLSTHMIRHEKPKESDVELALMDSMAAQDNTVVGSSH